MTNYSSRKILVLYCGGTIGQWREDKDTPYKPGSLADLRKNIPQLQELPYNLEYQEFLTNGIPIDSANADAPHYNALAIEIAKAHNNYDGIVVVYGTDTMAPSAAHISYMLEGLKKPVIFTGSMKAAVETDSDGPKNLTDAIHLAAKSGYDKEIPQLNEVVIAFHNKIYRATTAVKFNADAKYFGAFDFPEIEPLGEILSDGTIQLQKSMLLRPETDELKVNKIREDIKIFPINMMDGFISEKLLEHMCSAGAKESEAILVYNINRISAQSNKFKIIDEAGKPNKPIFFLNGPPPSADWIESKGIHNFQQAMAKINYVLSKTQEPKKIRELFQANLRGEGQGELAREGEILKDVKPETEPSRELDLR